MTIFSSNVLGAVAAIFTALAAVFGLLAFGKSYLEGKDKDAKLEEVRKKQEPRQLNMEAFGKSLKGKPRFEVELWYQPGDDEAFLLAGAISLGFARADFETADKSWYSIKVLPIPEDTVMAPNLPPDLPDSLKESMKRSVAEMSMALPLVMRAGANSLPSKSGVFVASNKNREISLPADDSTAYGALINAFVAGGIIPEAATAFDLPDNKLRIIVGSKP